MFAVDQRPDSTVLSEDTVAVLATNYSDNNLRAEFSRPLATELTDLNDCVTWNFITTPKGNSRTGSYGGRLRIPSRTKIIQICDVKRNCDIWAQFSSALENSGAFLRISAILQNYRKVRASLASSHSEPAESKSRGEKRKKRQSGSR
ncbi:hypothetical protein OESDEN_11167 [Oesophagostomum dentatum]|uniref:Uncharacterized protein n=1 Tax=Oesophagostomum dentatum TaxID=61180 RepID=A0A0B1SVP0_OESDE|nr:hypothetical protein OESDEN_11167 [Oesophagostomum dentatum]